MFKNRFLVISSFASSFQQCLSILHAASSKRRADLFRVCVARTAGRVFAAAAAIVACRVGRVAAAERIAFLRVSRGVALEPFGLCREHPAVSAWQTFRRQHEGVSSTAFLHSTNINQELSPVLQLLVYYLRYQLSQVNRYRFHLWRRIAIRKNRVFNESGYL